MENAQILELIEINEIKSRTITALINHEDTTQEQLDRCLACRRLIRSFISELKSIK